MPVVDLASMDSMPRHDAVKVATLVAAGSDSAASTPGTESVVVFLV